MSVLLIIDTVLLAVAIVYIVALLRSHADILRRLSLLEEAGSVANNEGDISGLTLDGEPIAGPAESRLLAFLTSGCASCRPFWEDLADPAQVAALGMPVTIVAHDEARESVSRLRELAPAGVELIMSDSAWREYAVPSSPHFVLLDGAGKIAGRGSAVSWQQLIALVGDARADTEAGLSVRTTGERAARAERALARAGINAGHPSLYPSESSDDPR